MGLQRLLGNREVRELVATGVIQTQKTADPSKAAQTDWPTAVAAAKRAAADPKQLKTAESLYKDLVVRAAMQVAAPGPLVDRKPKSADIRWSWKAKAEWAATTDPKRVDDFPADYWKWLEFNPSAVKEDEAFTVSILAHELDHAAHAKALYDQWRSAAVKKGWDDFYVEHFERWTEKPIEVGKSGGLVSALEGFPEKVQPSAIEFRAYATQFVNFFHRYAIDKQSYIAKALILFYPLVKQTAAEQGGDPALDLAAARQTVIDYFRAPPVKPEEQEVIKVRIAAEFTSALLFFRPEADHARIRTDFKEIFDFHPTTEESKEARRRYVPAK